MGGSIGETDTTEPTVMLPQNQATCVVALPLTTDVSTSKMHLRSSVQAQLPAQRAPYFPQRCLVNQRPAPQVRPWIHFFVSQRGVAWLIPIVRASNEGSPRPRVARAQGMTGRPSRSWSANNKKPAGFHQQAFFVTRQRSKPSLLVPPRSINSRRIGTLPPVGLTK